MCSSCRRKYSLLSDLRTYMCVDLFTYCMLHYTLDNVYPYDLQSWIFRLHTLTSQKAEIVIFAFMNFMLVQKIWFDEFLYEKVAVTVDSPISLSDVLCRMQNKISNIEWPFSHWYIG